VIKDSVLLCQKKELNMINIISAIGSLGTFIMALFYFVSVSVQLYQMKISFIPALGFNQILLIRDKDQRLNLKNTTSNAEEHEDHLKLYNLGGGAAKKITIEVLLGEDKVIQKNMLICYLVKKVICYL